MLTTNITIQKATKKTVFYLQYILFHKLTDSKGFLKTVFEKIKIGGKRRKKEKPFQQINFNSQALV